MERVGGSIAAAGVATNRPAGGAHRELDYFIVDRWIAHTVVKVEVDLSLDTKPHRAVTLVVRPAAANQLTPTYSPNLNPKPNFSPTPGPNPEPST